MTKYLILYFVLLQTIFSSAFGECVYFNDCPEAVKLIKNRRHDDPELIQLLTSLTCGNSSRKDKIWCEKITRLSPTNKEDLLEKNCGIQAPVSKITNGEKAEFQDFPWFALLRYKINTKFIYRCQGSLISKRYVVTAAHCVEYSPVSRKRTYGDLYSIVLGEYNIETEEDCINKQFNDCNDPIQEIFPESVHVHPKFGSENALSDIALIRLEKSANFSDYVKPICLPLNFIPLQPDEPLEIGGWGITENGKRSTIKLKARLRFIPKEKCKANYIYHPDGTQMCAGSDSGADTCQGDSGGSLMASRRDHNSENRTILVGVVSFGRKCGGRAAIYTNVTKFVDWILETMM